MSLFDLGKKDTENAYRLAKRFYNLKLDNEALAIMRGNKAINELHDEAVEKVLTKLISRTKSVGQIGSDYSAMITACKNFYREMVEKGNVV